MSTGGFSNPVAGGGGALVRNSVHSPNWVSGTTGWTINQDGTAEFNTLGGTVQFSALGIFFYVPNAGLGNLRLSITTVAGTDPYGNGYNAGLFVNQQQIWATGDHSDSVLVNPNGSLFPTIAWTPALSAEVARIIGRADTNRLVLQTTAANALIEANGPFVATGGYQGSNTAQGAQPPFNVTGAFTDYLTASWTPPSLHCPASETIAVNITGYGFNNNTTTSTVSIGFRLKVGATTLLAPALGQNSISITPEGSAAGVSNNRGKFVQYIVGTDILGGRAGQTLTVVPAWHISSGTALTATITNGSISAYPLAFVQPQSG